MDVLPKDRLVVLHNLTREKLLDVLRLGVLPVPSLGVTKAVAPYVEFGEVSLIGVRPLADPRFVPVCAHDAYTPSAPKAGNGCILKAKNAEEAMRRMTSPAAQRRRGPYGTGRLLADAAGRFASMEAMQAARGKVVEASRARADWNYLDGLLDRFALGLASCHQPLRPVSAAVGEASALKALLTAYRRGAGRADLLGALARRRFFWVPHGLVDVGVEILGLLALVPTPYFEAKPSRLVRLEEFVGAVIPRGSPSSMTEALRAAGLQVRPFAGETAPETQAHAVRSLAFELARAAGDFLYPVTTARILFKRRARMIRRGRACVFPSFRHQGMPSRSVGHPSQPS